MKELKLKDQQVIESVKQVKVEKKIIGSLFPYKGHTLYEYNKVTYQLQKAKFKPLSFPMSDNNKLKIVRNRVDARDNCYYISCLNIENATRKLMKMFNPEFIAVFENE